MGNRAIITNSDKNMGIYLHWNGGRDSVEAFLEYCRLKGFRSPDYDESYAFARMVQVVANYFGGSTSIGIVGNCKDEVCTDNGNYIIGKDWKIVDREYPYEDFEEQNEYKLQEMLKEIDKAQPKEEQLGRFLDSKEVNVSELKKGDMVYLQDYSGKYEKHKIIGFGKDEVVNGTNVLNKPYVNKYNKQEEASKNLNNYILSDKVRICDKARELSNDMEVD